MGVSSEGAGETPLVSELIDLEGVPLSIVRTLDTPAVRRTLGSIAAQTGRQARTETQCSSLTRF